MSFSMMYFRVVYKSVGNMREARTPSSESGEENLDENVGKYLDNFLC